MSGVLPYTSTLTPPASQFPSPLCSSQQAYIYSYELHQLTPLLLQYPQLREGNEAQLLCQTHQVKYEAIYEHRNNQYEDSYQFCPPIYMEYLPPAYCGDGCGAGTGGAGPGTFALGGDPQSFHIHGGEDLGRPVGYVTDEFETFSSNEADALMASQRQQNHYQPITQLVPSRLMASHLTAVPAQNQTILSNNQQSLAVGAFRPNHQPPPLPLDEQFTKLRSESCFEIQRQLNILQQYYIHSLRVQFRDLQPATDMAQKHWILVARHWESTIPPDWRIGLDPLPREADTIPSLLYRQVRIHVVIETHRRNALGMPYQSFPAYQDNLNLEAFQGHLWLMGMWTRMFEEMLQALRLEFPLLEDALRKWEEVGGWDQSQYVLDGGIANILGV